MKLRILGLVVLLGVFAFVPAGNATVGTTAHSAIVNYVSPVRVGPVTLIGTCLVVHDDAKMAKGEPCTSIYKIDGNGRRQLAVSFHCVPSQGKAVSLFTTAVRSIPGLTTIKEMVSYQFAGETEAHGVPANLN